MSDPLGGFLEGAVGGFGSGFEFREAIKDRRRRRQIEQELHRLRVAGAQQRLREGERAEAERVEETGQAFVPSRVPRLEFNAPEFGPDAPPDQELRFLRGEVGRALGGPEFTARFPERTDMVTPRLRPRIEFGGLEQIGTPRAVAEELGYDPSLSTGALEGDIARAGQPTTAQQVGQALGDFTGRKLTPAQQILAGRGAIPFSALASRPRPTAAARPPITLNQALQQVDRLVGEWDPVQLTYKFPSHVTPAMRHDLAQKLVAGTATEEDFRRLMPPPEPEGGPTSTPPKRKGLLRSIGEALFGGSEEEPSPERPTAPTGRPDRAADPTAQSRVEGARQLLDTYADLDLPREEMEAILEDAGFTPEEVEQILGPVPVGP